MEQNFEPSNEPGEPQPAAQLEPPENKPQPPAAEVKTSQVTFQVDHTAGANPNTTPTKSSSTKTILIALVAAIVLCCLCAAVGGIGYFLFAPSGKVQLSVPTPTNLPPTLEPTVPRPTAPPPAKPTPTKPAKPTFVPQKPTGGEGLGVTRDDMISFFNQGDAFTFSKPYNAQGVEAVTGTHKSLCIKTDCAAVTLLGPQQDLLAIGVAVPTDPNDQGQTLTAIALLMDTVAHFGDNALATQIMGDLTKAQAAGLNFENTIQNNGYKFTEQYDPSSHIAGVTVSRPK